MKITPLFACFVLLFTPGYSFIVDLRDATVLDMLEFAQIYLVNVYVGFD